VSHTSPYRGLAPFEDSEVDALYFFGRERDTEIVVANLIASRLTVLYGPSGVGKSSLLLASVARSLRELPESPLVVVHSSWSDPPEATLAAAVAEHTGLEPASLIDVVERAQSRGDVYVILDQAEEYFTYHDDAAGFESVLATLINSPLRVNVLVSLREDTLARLDRLKRRIPNLFANVLRLDRLDRTAGRAAIVMPLARWSELEGEEVAAEGELVEAILDGVETGDHAPAGGPASTNGPPSRIEAPYLQLVMQTLWEVERQDGSRLLRLATLDRLGGPRRIVAEHLDRAMRDLSPERQNVAAAAFTYLVTASGAKYAHRAGDLAAYAGVSVAVLEPVLETLVDRRILRRDESDRYEIFHDVLAGEVLDWRRRHDAAQAVQRERTAGRRRQRRLGAVALLALVGLGVTSGLAVWALTERRNATAQASAAQAAEERATEQTAVAKEAQANAEQQATAARRARQEALRQAAAAQESEEEAVAARADAEAAAQSAEDAEQRALDQAAVAQSERDRANEQAAIAEAASKQASEQAVAATQSAAAARTARDRATQAAVAANARQQLAVAQSLLAVDPERSLQAALDSLGLDPTSPVEAVLREGLLRSRMLDVLPGGGGEVVSVSLGADAGATQSRRLGTAAIAGGALVTASRSGVVRVFDPRSGAVLRTVRTGRTIGAASLSSDRSTLAVAGPDGIVRLYLLATGVLIRAIDHVGPVSSVGFSPDGRLLVSTGTNETAKLWDTSSGALVRRLSHPRAVRSASFSADGTMLATLSSDPFVRVYDVAAGRLIARLEQDDAPTSAVFSPDGRAILTTGQDETPRIWEASTGKPLLALTGHSGNVLAGAYTPTGDRVATASSDGTARVWDAKTGALLHQLTGHTSFVDAVTFSPDGRQLLTGSRDGTARLWNAVTGATQGQLLGHRSRVTAVAFGDDGRWAVTSSDDGTARTWTLPSDPQLAPIASGSSPVVDLAVSADGRRVVEARADGTVSVRSATGRLVIGLRLDTAATGVALSRRADRLLATGDDGSVVVWALPSGSVLRRFDQGSAATSGTFLPDGREIVVAGRDGAVRAWTIADGRMRVVARETGPVTDVAVDAEGTSLATAVGDVAHVRPLRGGRVVQLVGHRDAVTSVSFDPSGRQVLTTSFDHDAVLWSAATGARLKSFIGHVAVVRGAAFTPDGRWIATAGPTRAGMWEAGPSTLVDSRLYYLAGHQRAINAVAFSGVGFTLFTGGADGTVRRYDCRLCGGTDVLRRIAAAKLARLARDEKR
jgi:WD40 repeat protein